MSMTLELGELWERDGEHSVDVEAGGAVIARVAFSLIHPSAPRVRRMADAPHTDNEIECFAIGAFLCGLVRCDGDPSITDDWKSVYRVR